MQSETLDIVYQNGKSLLLYRDKTCSEGWEVDAEGRQVEISDAGREFDRLLSVVQNTAENDRGTEMQYARRVIWSAAGKAKEETWVKNSLA